VAFVVPERIEETLLEELIGGLSRRDFDNA
jgi:hypothetical protein